MFRSPYEVQFQGIVHFSFYGVLMSVEIEFFAWGATVPLFQEKR